MATVEQMPAERRFVLHGVDWQTYVALRETPENYHVRMTYDRGELEMMSPSKKHEQYALLIGRLIDVWCEETGVDILGCRTMTCRRADLESGFEPDNCFYVQNEPLLRSKDELDLTVDPPPDLAIEVDLRSHAFRKLDLYAAFGVPEVWRYDGQTLQVYELGPQGRYTARDSSVALPGFRIARAQQALGQIGTLRDMALVRAFRDWVRGENSGGGALNP